MLSLYTFCSTTYLYNFHLRGYNLPLPILDDLAVEHDGLFGPDISRRGPDAEKDQMFFQFPAQPFVLWCIGVIDLNGLLWFCCDGHAHRERREHLEQT